MSQRLQFNSNGLYVLGWDRDKQVWQPTHKPVASTILTQLRYPCDIVEGATLRTILNTVYSYPLLNAFLKKYVENENLDQFYMHAQLPSEDTYLTHIKISKYADEESHVERRKHKGGLRERIIGVEYHVFGGVSAIGPDPAYPEIGPISHNVSTCAINTIADLPIRFSTKFVVEIPPISGTENAQRKENSKLFESEQDFSLLELLDTIYYELSFYGLPEDHERL